MIFLKILVTLALWQVVKLQEEGKMNVSTLSTGCGAVVLLFTKYHISECPYRWGVCEQGRVWPCESWDRNSETWAQLLAEHHHLHPQDIPPWPRYSYQDTLTRIHACMYPPTHVYTCTHYYKKPLIIHIVLHTGVGQCACTTDIKQLWEKMDRVQDSVAANNASSQGKLHVLTFCRRLSTFCRWHDLFTRYILQ